MERIHSGEGTCDMATRICLFGIKRDNIKNVKAIEAIIIDKEKMRIMRRKAREMNREFGLEITARREKYGVNGGITNAMSLL